MLPAELSAASVLISFWTPAGQTDSTCTTGICNNAMWVGLMLVVVVSAFPLYSDHGLISCLIVGS